MKSLSLLALPAALVITSLASAQQPAPSESNLESGGLKPPEAIDPAQPQQQPTAAPEQELAEADRKDAGRGLEWVWLNAEIGVQHVGLGTFSEDGLVDADTASTQTGLLYGAGVGVRLLVFTAGVRFRMGSFSEWKLWTLDAEGGLRIPLGSLEPYVTVAAGYASLGSLAGVTSKAPRGLDARLGAGLDWYISNTFSIGANLSGELLVLSRSANGDSSSPVYSADGSSVGGGLSLTALAGLHF